MEDTALIAPGDVREGRRALESSWSTGRVRQDIIAGAVFEVQERQGELESTICRLQTPQYMFYTAIKD